MNRKQTYEYKRILEILKDYWLTEPDELVVRVRMDFMHANGDTQNKQIVWWNPEYKIPTEYYGEPITAEECIKQVRDREEWLKEHRPYKMYTHQQGGIQWQQLKRNP